MDSEFTNFLSSISCLISNILMWVAGLVVFFIASRISHFIKKRRGNPERYWEKFWAEKRAEEEERLKDPSVRAQIVWDEQEQQHKENQRQVVRQVITATGRYKNCTPMTAAEVIRKIQNEEWPFESWMLDEYLDGALVSESLTPVQRIARKISTWVDSFEIEISM